MLYSRSIERRDLTSFCYSYLFSVNLSIYFFLYNLYLILSLSLKLSLSLYFSLYIYLSLVARLMLKYHCVVAPAAVILRTDAAGLYTKRSTNGVWQQRLSLDMCFTIAAIIHSLKQHWR